MDNPVKMAISGDKQAFIEIIGRNADMLYRIALSYLKNRDEAQEAVQEVTFRAYRNIKSLQSEEFFNTWLVRILINYCNNELKRRSKTILSLDFLPADTSEDMIQKLTLEEAVYMLPHIYKEVIILRYFHDMKINTISQVTGHPEGTVKVRIKRALEMLEKKLDKESVQNESKYRSGIETNW